MGASLLAVAKYIYIIPGTMGYVIYSPGTAPRATCVRLFLFRFSIAMQKTIAFS